MKNNYYNILFVIKFIGVGLFSPTICPAFFDTIVKELGQEINKSMGEKQATDLHNSENKARPEQPFNPFTSLLGGKQKNNHPVQAQQKTVTKIIAIALKNINLRSGPGTHHKKTGSLKKGSPVIVLETQGNWLQIRGKNIPDSWGYKPLFSIKNSQPLEQGPQANRQNVAYAGYSKDFQEVKKMMAEGNLKGVDAFYTEREAKILNNKTSKWEAIHEIGLLGWMERGTLFLDEGNLKNSARSFSNAETLLNARHEEGKLQGWFNTAINFTAETVTGKGEEFLNYKGVGYEKVLMLNYKSISYLLEGERKAYNVTRHAIDWQNLEKARFQKEIEQVTNELNEKKGTETESLIDDSWKSSYKKLDKIATRVPSAFVNPFGYYVAGMIQEFESKNDPSLRDNARIAYQKALELSPGNSMLLGLVKKMKNKYPSGKRLIHIVVGDGFAPEKKVLTYNIPAQDRVIPVKLPIYEPVPSMVSRIEIQTQSGKRLARLERVSDIEALSLRHQKDNEIFRVVRVALSVVRAIAVNSVTVNKDGNDGGLLAPLVTALQEGLKSVKEMAVPDMRSWMSLPASISAARIVISNNTSKLKLVTYNAKGKRLATKTIKINKKSDNFIYGRSINRQLYVQNSKSLWTAN